MQKCVWGRATNTGSNWPFGTSVTHFALENLVYEWVDFFFLILQNMRQIEMEVTYLRVTKGKEIERKESIIIITGVN